MSPNPTRLVSSLKAETDMHRGKTVWGDTERQTHNGAKFEW